MTYFNNSASQLNNMNYNYGNGELWHPYSEENASGSSRSFVSNLQPTAQEFIPSFKRTTDSERSVPANRNGRYPRYGSGRTFYSNGNYNRDVAATSSSTTYSSSEVQSVYGNSKQRMGECTEDSERAGLRGSRSAPTQFRNYNKSKKDTASSSYQPSYDSRYNKYKINKGNKFNYKNSSGNMNNDFQFNSLSNGYDNRMRNKGTTSWRNQNKSFDRSDTKSKVDKSRVSAASQRERLTEMINQRILECLVCCEKIKSLDKVWSCMQCYNMFHLACVSAWAKSSKVENSWRCPACQNICSETPEQYKCYCGKVLDPKNDPSIIPHGCGDMCLRKGRNCEHKCTILCHPGPCPDCNIMVQRSCGCGVTQQTVKCSSDLAIVCDAFCNKMLECGIHYCLSKCHLGPCPPCSEVLIQECYCGKTGRKVTCTSQTKGQKQFCCENPCQKSLACGNHKCEKQCHPGDCGPCKWDVKLINSCYCGKTPLKEERKSCLDPVPCCNKTCGKNLSCGQPSTPHVCKEKCHEGNCPPCHLTTVVKCRCGHMDKEVPCVQLTTKADDARCEKKCNKKRLCGKHKCNQRCCIEVEHVCPLPCNHMLSCGLHRCERTCHSGRCPSCLETSFEELFCECGASVLYPPVPCGTKPPPCSRPCSKPKPCDHPPNHECHSGPCPPCFVLTKRWCYGHHEQRAAIPCHQQHFSCGMPCGKQMPCGRHKCVKPCHDGECPIPCIQPCKVRRALCGHPCNKPCHDPPCPDSSCKQMVPITCICGLQKSSKPCVELSDEYRNIEMVQLKEKMGAMSADQTVDISDIVNKVKRPSVLKILECNEECKVLERNRRLAIGLQIRNPELSQKLTPRYSDFMRQWAKRDPNFVQKVHDKLTELVQLAKQSKQKSRSHSFESMNRDRRHFIHEYCEHFGVESAAYDMEPNRNVVATAIKDKSWLPSMSLLEVLQRENGQRKVPGPMLASSSTSRQETVSMRVSSRPQKPTIPFGETFDYFDPE